MAPALEYWRNQCDLRRVGLALAYFDIDNFKADFNRYTETVVDQNCLPVIMRAIEAHVFCRAFAYHEGGDESIILMPNIDKNDAIEFMDRLRLKLPTLTFAAIPAKARISIGLCHVEPDSALTDDEIRQMANEAKRAAKIGGGKDCIVTAPDMQVVKPDERAGLPGD